MAARSGVPVSPARYGLTADDAQNMAAMAGWWPPDDRNTPLLRALAGCADPNSALHGLDRLRQALSGERAADWQQLRARLESDGPFRARMLGVLSCSTGLSDHIVVHPDTVWLLGAEADSTHPMDAAGMRARLLHAVGADPDAPVAGSQSGARASLQGRAAIRELRSAYRSELTRIAAADTEPTVQPELPHPGYERITTWLVELAEAALEAALAVATAEALDNVSSPEERQPRLAVIAMGKCGAYELNYVSDVDVVFVAEPESEIPLATRMATGMMRVAGEACFQVDADLRPEGRSGAVVRTLEGHANYYRRWAHTWEFQALLKARPAVGDPELGAAYSQALAPMVWAASERENFVSDTRAMRRRVEEHVPAGVADRELKLGPGGLRDVEFAVQLLQLVHGRSDEQLRVRPTVSALRMLASGGYVARRDAAELGESYIFLRQLEHRLQLRSLRRTHLFPAASEREELSWLARSVSIRPTARAAAADSLLSEVARHQQRVRRIHEKLFYRPLLDAVARLSTDDLRLSPRAATARLSALGFASPEGALEHLRALTAGVSRRAAIQSTLLPPMLEWLAEGPEPDAGLLAYRKVSEELAQTHWYLRLLRDEGAVAQRLAFLLSTSRLVPELLVRAPEVLHSLGEVASLAGIDPESAAGSLTESAGRYPDPETAVAAARSLRRRELLRVACADLLGQLDAEAAAAVLSAVWAAVLDASVAAVLRAERRHLGGAPPARIAVIGMGRLGGAELGYGSDADVLIICAATAGASDAEAVSFATRVATAVRALLAKPSVDPALEVDLDLRPEGRQGPMVRTLDSYRTYYSTWADTWELQALLRARPVAGDGDLGRRFLAEIDPLRYPEGGLSREQVTEVRRLKVRVETERMPRGTDPALHTKLGRGGLADIEWTLQLLQLRFAGQHPGLRTPHTVAGLRAAACEGVLAEADAETLVEAWRTATATRNALTLVRGKPTDAFPRSGAELAQVARALGFSDSADPAEAVEHYRRHSRRARGVIERVFYED